MSAGPASGATDVDIRVDVGGDRRGHGRTPDVLGPFMFEADDPVATIAPVRRAAHS